MRYLRLGAVVVALVILAAGMTTDVEAYSEGWETLKGHDTVGVAVEGLMPAAEKLGLTREHLKTVVERRLRKAGIAVVPQQTTVNCLYVRLGTIASEYTYAATLNASFMQPVMLPSWDYGIAETWSGVAKIWMGSGQFARQSIFEMLDKLMDDFINDWLRANPKE